MKRWLGFGLLFAGMVVALAAIPGSWAISQSRLDRTPSAILSADGIGGVGLTGFANQAYVMTNNYGAVGTITNNFSQPFTWIVTMDPNITQGCRSFNSNNNKCTVGDWTVNLCLATDQWSVGNTTCATAGAGSASNRTFTGTGTSNPPAQSFAAITTSAGQSLYLMVKGSIANATGTARGCGDAVLSLTASRTKGESVSLSHSAAVPRRIVLRAGSGCP